MMATIVLVQRRNRDEHCVRWVSGLQAQTNAPHSRWAFRGTSRDNNMSAERDLLIWPERFSLKETTGIRNQEHLSD